MILDLKAYAKENHVPIITDEGLELIKELSKKHQYQYVLEIGTAIGYSAIAMALFGLKVDSIERDQNMYHQAMMNIQKANLSDRIYLIHHDALSYQPDKKTYDIIFIDGAKSQYKNFFNTYEKYLNPHGMIICDNLHFHHLDPNKVNRNTKQLLRKIHEFILFLKEHPSFDTVFYDIGDGMSVSQRKKK